MKKLWEKIKNFGWGYLLFALLFVGAGVLFLSFPDRALNGVRVAIGITALVFAAVYVALTLAKRGRGFGFWCRMILGGFCIVCGGFMCFAREGAFSYLIFACGLVLLIDGAFKLQTAILSKRYRSWHWWVMLALAVSTLVFGAILVRKQFDLSSEEVLAARLLGIGLLLDGVANLLSIGYLLKIEKGKRREVEDQLRAEGLLPEILPADPASDPAPLASGEAAPAIDAVPTGTSGDTEDTPKE